jgi:transcriptional regulator of arginine metabolism
MRKEERQRLIELLIGRKELSTQAELVAALAESGCTVTQATVSRDMREMGVRKGSDRGGRVRYMMPPPRVRRDPEELLARVLAESAATVRAARNLVVIRSEPGTASNVGRAIDELENDDLIGTVAGDDTVLLVLADEAAAGRMEDYLEEMIR